MTAAPLLVGCALHDGADIDACGCPALDSPGAIAYRGLLVKARAEIARITAELAAARKELDAAADAGIKRGRSWEATEWEAAFGVRNRREAVAKLRAAEDALTAARAVPADVEAVIGDLKIAAADFGIAQDGVATGCAFATEHRGEASARMRSATDALRTAIARAISEAEQRAVGDFLDRAKTLSTGAGTGKSPVEAAILDYRNAVADWEHDDPISGSGKDAERRQCDAYIALLAAIGDATVARGTVGGLLATAPVARPISEWHEDHGDALWWRFPIEEPPYCGSPISDDWPGDYHTHWTPIVCPDEPNQRGPLPNGDRRATHRCSKCRGISSHTPGGIPCDECGLVGSMPWGG